MLIKLAPKMRNYILLLICSIGTFFVSAQDFSNKGKDFWVAYGNHVRMFGNSAAEKMQIYITSDVSTTGLVEIPSISFSQSYTVTANQITTVDIPRTAALLDEGQYNHGIHVTANSPVVVYSFIYVNAISGATLCLPTNVLGREYYSINYTQLSNEGNSYSYFAVVATEDATTVEITPSQASKGGKAANVPFTVTLNKGQIYQLLSNSDLTGSKIKSISVGSSSCKRIGVFSGSGKISIGCTTTAGSSDNLYQQVYPNSSWGKKYITVPSTNNGTNFQTNFYRIIRPDPTSIVKLNGAIIPSASFTNNLYYQFSNNTTNLIESDKGIMVAQYFTTTTNGPNCGNSGIGDPEMFYLNSIEQNLNKVTLNSMQPSTGTAITTHFLNVFLKNTPGAINTFKIDGISYASRFSPVAQDPTYAYARIQIAAQGHTVTCDSGFNAIACGFGSAESYAYSAGSNVLDLYQYVTLQNQYATVNFPSTCKGTPFKFSITLPYQPTSLEWNFNNNVNLSPNTNVINTSPVADSSFVIDGRTLYVYKLPQFYSFSATGVYPIKVVANNPTSDGCSGLQEISYDVQVFDKPIADFNFTNTGCFSDPVNFFDITNGFGRPTIKWKWEFGDATIDSVKNPIKQYTSPGTGTYNVKFTSITDIGCITDTTKPIAISSVPLAKFGVSDTTCAGKTIVYTDSSSIVVGNIVKWYWDYGNGIKDTLTNNTIPRTLVYNTAGTYTVTLTVESNTGCKSIVFTKNVIVHDNPVTNFSLPIVCLPVGAATFNNLTTIADGTINTVAYSWDFGDGGFSTAVTGVHNYASTGPFTVKLTATSQYGCIKDSIKTLSTVYVAPTATFTVNAETCLRDSTVFTDGSNPGTGNTIANWYWNRDATGGAAYTDTVQNFKYRYGVAGNYTVKMYYKTDKGCVSDTATRTHIVNPLPTAQFINSALLCEKNDVLFTPQSVPNAGSITRWYWDMGNTTINNFSNNNPFSLAYLAWNNYTVKHMVETDKGCKSDTAFKVLNIRPLPHVGFMIPEVCLADAAAVFTDTTTIADGSQASFTYNWNFNLTGVTPGPTPATSLVKNGTTTYNKSDNYQVKLTVKSNAGCIDSLTQAFTVNGSIPKSDFTVLNPAALCSNLPAQIQNISTVDFGWLTKVEIYWDFLNNPAQKIIDDTPTVGEIYNHLYANFQQPANKTYTIRFVAYSGGTCADVKTRTVTINASPLTQFVTMPGICFDAVPRQITQASEIGGVAGSSPAFAYYGNGVSSTGLFSPALAGVGTFPIKYVYTSNIGCMDSATRNITVWPSPTAKFGISSPVCEKNDITFTDSSAANYSNIINWAYNFNDGTTLTRNNATAFTKSYLTGNTYNATLVVTTDSGCVSPVFTKPILVNYLPVVNFALPEICLPDGRGTFDNLTTIPDNSEALFTYLWNFGDVADPTPSVLKNPTHQYTALAPTGGYLVKLKVTSKDGCVDSLTKPFSNVYPQPQAKFDIAPITKAVCIGDTLFFTDKSDGKTSAVNTWKWTFGDNTTSSVQNPYRVYTDTNTYQVQLVIFNTQGCISDTAKDVVIVNPYPKLNAGADLFVLEGGTVQIKPSFYATNPSFLWSTVTYPIVYLDSIDIAYPRSTPPDDITYIVKLTGIGGCSVSDDVFIRVLKAPVIPNAFSPNGDNINDTWEIKYLESYPGATIEVYDRGGRLVYNSFNYTKNWDGTIVGKPLPIGTYYYIINPKNGRKLMSGSVTIIR